MMVRYVMHLVSTDTSGRAHGTHVCTCMNSATS